jgi:hypothetical protein
MSFTTKIRCLCEATGSGDDRKVVGFSILTTPTQVSGPIRQVFTTTAAVERVSIISGQLVMLYIEAVSSGLFVNPFASTPMTSCCAFISEGAFMYVPFKTTTSALPWAEAQTARAEAEIWVVGIS